MVCRRQRSGWRAGRGRRSIFAGWLVWTQTRDQIAANEKLRTLNDQRNNEFKIKTLSGEIKYLEFVGAFLDRLLQPFTSAGDDDSDYRVKLIALSTRGELIFHPSSGWALSG